MARRRIKLSVLALLAWVILAPVSAWAQEGPSAMDLKVIADSLWVMVAAMMVFFMNAGFATLEAGLCQSKNTVNILAKNFVVFAMASLSFWVIGWGLMFGDGTPWLGTQGIWFLSGADNSPATGEAYQGVYSAMSWATVPIHMKFFFQLVFAATAATIVSGVVAERIKFISFLIFSLILVALMYPTTGHWIWGGGWLAAAGFWDFAGSTVVHSVGGWAALVGGILLGARKGKYDKDGKVQAIPGHSLPLATIGTFILWLGWFGFNPGSTMAADGAAIGRIAIVTNTAAVAGVITSMITAWLVLGKPDLSMILNGCLAGLVGITASCAYVSVGSALLIGGVAGSLAVLAVLFFDKLRLDDPVGALSVHLVNGIWGTLAVGLFAQDHFMPNTTGNGLFFGGGAKLLGAQALGVVSVGLFTVLASLAVWLLIKLVLGLRVNEEEEREGLDYGEHGNNAYPDFVGATSHSR